MMKNEKLIWKNLNNCFSFIGEKQLSDFIGDIDE